MTARRVVALVCAGAICASGGASDGIAQSPDTTQEVPHAVATSLLERGDWRGPYVGGTVGFSQGPVIETVSSSPSGDAHTVFGRLDGGLLAGYNAVVARRILLGGEADIAFPNFFEDGAIAPPLDTRSGILADEVDMISTVRARIGWTSGRWLFYTTVGASASQLRLVDSATASRTADVLTRRPIGLVWGAGAELSLTGAWRARMEYLSVPLGHTTGSLAGASVASQAMQHSIRIGMSVAFGIPHHTRPSPTTTGATPPRWSLHGQTTFVEQAYPRFRSPYDGTNSLSGTSQAKNTASATAFVGIRLWTGLALYFNPEVDQGFGLNDTHGVAAFPNGEAQKASFPMPRFVVDRLILRQTFGLGGPREVATDGPNQLAELRDVSRVTIVAGRLAVTDYFDNNTYANDPRTNFLNWNLYGAGAYDWTMDQLSWTWGALAELNQRHWAVRAGYFLLPTVSSTNSFDTHIPERGEYAAELEWRYLANPLPGTVRLFGWVNHGTMGSYAAALALPLDSPAYPDITATREVRTNPGFVLNAEQAISDQLGIYSRVSWSPGRVEILGGTDCDESASLGALVGGASWGRPDDRIGLGGVVGGLSPIARAYFAAGGLGILIGDGRLDYRPEKVSELYYGFAVRPWLMVGLDYQFVADPAYNADRGPVSIFGVRLHSEF